MCKWLDLLALSQALLPTAVIRGINYYTARVSGAADPSAPRRQQIYLSALATLGLVKVHYGTFLAKDHWRPIAHLPVADRQITGPNGSAVFTTGLHSVAPDPALTRSTTQNLVVGKHGTPPRGTRPAAPANPVMAQVCTMEEKGSDVNLAVHLVNDAWAGRFEAAAVLSNDTDLVEPIRIVTQERGCL